MICDHVNIENLWFNIFVQNKCLDCGAILNYYYDTGELISITVPKVNNHDESRSES